MLALYSLLLILDHTYPLYVKSEQFAPDPADVIFSVRPANKPFDICQMRANGDGGLPRPSDPDTSLFRRARRCFVSRAIAGHDACNAIDDVLATRLVGHPIADDEEQPEKGRQLDRAGDTDRAR
jgi:hypothetical protein